MGYGVGATTVSYPMAASVYTYILRLLELGAVEGPLGDMKLAEDLGPVVDALHHCLAGGEVAIQITRPGHPDVVSDLERRVAEGTRDANEINGAAGYYVSLLP